MDTINGLPAHPLLVHFAIVGVLATAVVAATIALWPRARQRLGVFPTVLALVCLILVPITTSAGESLEAMFPQTEAIERHAELGDELILLVGPLFGLLALLWLVRLPAVAGRVIRRTECFRR